MCIYPIGQFAPHSYFYRRLSSYDMQPDGQVIFGALKDKSGYYSCRWCIKSNCLRHDVCNDTLCQTEQLFKKPATYNSVLYNHNGDWISTEMPFSILKDSFPTVDIKKNIKPFFEIRTGREVILLETFNSEKYEKEKSNLTSEISQAIEFLLNAEKSWKVCAIQVQDIANAGFLQIRQMQPEQDPGHTEICQTGFSESELVLKIKKLRKHIISIDTIISPHKI